MTQTAKVIEQDSVLVDETGKQISAADVKPIVKASSHSQLSGTDALIAMALEKDLDMDKLERLFQMKEREEEKTAKSLFNTAMAAVQNKIQPIIADAENEHTGSRYAKLVSIITALAPIYTEHGFSVSYGQAKCDDAELVADKWFRTTAELSHAGGYAKNFYVDLPADIRGSGGKVNKTLIHGTKSTITYARGILMGLMFNFTTAMDVDDDGNSAANTTITPEQAAGLRDELASLEADEVYFCKWLKVKSLEDITEKLLPKAQNAIAQQKAAKK